MGFRKILNSKDRLILNTIGYFFCILGVVNFYLIDSSGDDILQISTNVATRFDQTGISSDTLDKEVVQSSREALVSNAETVFRQEPNIVTHSWNILHGGP